MFPIVRRPGPDAGLPVLVSVPHLGTHPLPDITRADYREPRFETFAYGYADMFAGDVYGDLHEHGATVLATPISRLFVDVNRRRDDFERHGVEVRSRRGVVRTHTIRDVPIFARPLEVPELEARLRAHYDPYYAALDRLLDDLRRRHGRAVLLDGHTGSPRRMREHQVIIGTCRDATCSRALADATAAVFRRHRFEVHENVSGYTGGNIVATYGRPHVGIHALQIEINAALLTRTAGDELVGVITNGGVPERAAETIARVRRALQDVLTVAASVVPAG